MEKLLLNVSEVMKITGLSKPTVYRLMTEGRLKYVQIGRAKRVTRNSLEEFLKGVSN